MRRILLLLVGASLALSVFSVESSSRSGPPRPNILWLVGDDLGVELGCYGTAAARTPNLDRLASNGMRFTRFYTTGAVCSSSRSAFMTAMYQQTIHAENHRTAEPDKRPLPDGVKLLTDWFRDAGYFTGNLGEFPASFGFKIGGKTDWNFKVSRPPFDTNRWADLAGHRPFYAQINFSEPHRPFKAPRVIDRAGVVLPPYYPEHPVAREDWAAYLDSGAELDRKVGLVLRQLETDGLADDTIIVFFGDNGRCHVRDKQFCYEEGLHVPLIIRWPKNFPAPRGFAPGKTSDQLIPAIDLGPTMLALAGAPPMERTQGRVFLGDRAEPAREFVFGGRDRCDETEMTLRTARDARYRYIRNLTPEVPLLAANQYKETQYPVWNLLKQLKAEGKLTPAQAALCAPHQVPEELYDLASDPDQLHNLAASTTSEHQRALARLRTALDGWLKEIR